MRPADLAAPMQVQQGFQLHENYAVAAAERVVVVAAVRVAAAAGAGAVAVVAVAVVVEVDGAVVVELLCDKA